jgi:hypothetical protein
MCNTEESVYYLRATFISCNEQTECVGNVSGASPYTAVTRTCSTCDQFRLWYSGHTDNAKVPLLCPDSEASMSYDP